MAHRRMFSPDIVESEEFLSMPVSSQALYFHLGMNADDDGFIQPKLTLKMIGANEDDLKVLLAKRFLLPFETGVVVIKHWLIHNMIRADRYKPTRFQNEKKTLKIKDNKAYTERLNSRQPNGNQMAPQVRLGKDRIGKVRLIAGPSPADEIISIIDLFKEVNPSYKKWYANTTQRSACSRLIEQHGMDKLKSVIPFLTASNNTPYIPSATTPLQLEDKWAAIESAWNKKKTELKAKERTVIL